MASRTLRTVVGLTPGRLFSTRSTVAVLTPAASAILVIVTEFDMGAARKWAKTKSIRVSLNRSLGQSGAARRVRAANPQASAAPESLLIGLGFVLSDLLNEVL